MKVLDVFGLLTVVCLALTNSGCKPAEPDTEQPAESQATAAEAGPRTFQVKGIVREIKPNGTTAMIKHEEIPDYMMAMTMPFDARDPKELEGLNPGDQVTFRLNVTDTDGWIDQVKVVGHEEPGNAKPKVPSIRMARVVEELREGDTMPDYPFTNEWDRQVRLSDYSGRAIGMTFIYTRCPYPTFCPRQSRQFAAASERLKAMENGPKNWHLLSVSFDPGYDTPDVLLEYGKEYGYDPVRWSFLIGEIIEIDAITEQFGMIVSRDGEGFSHNVRTVVIDAAGKIRKILVGNEWTVDEFVEEMVLAAKAK